MAVRTTTALSRFAHPRLALDGEPIPVSSSVRGRRGSVHGCMLRHLLTFSEFLKPPKNGFFLTPTPRAAFLNF